MRDVPVVFSVSAPQNIGEVLPTTECLSAFYLEAIAETQVGLVPAQSATLRNPQCGWHLRRTREVLLCRALDKCTRPWRTTDHRSRPVCPITSFYFVRILPHRVEKLQHGLETAVLRGEVSTVRELAYLRSCVEPIEDHLKLRLDELGIQKRH